MEVTKVHDISILHLFGEVSFLEMEHIEHTLHSLKKSRHNKVLIDMTSVDHVHYLVIKRLIESARTLREVHGDLKLVHPNSETKEVIRFTGADQFLEDYASISEAILSFLSQSDTPRRLYQ